MGTGLTSLETVRGWRTSNAADSTGYGAVGYVYQMGKYEVTNSQYCEFLNAKAVTDTYGLYNTSMSSDARGGINRSGSSGSYTYAVKSGYENMPVTYVCWYDAIRFANWLQNGQGSGSTETGTYTITGGGYNSGTVAIPNAATRATWTGQSALGAAQRERMVQGGVLQGRRHQCRLLDLSDAEQQRTDLAVPSGRVQCGELLRWIHWLRRDADRRATIRARTT